MTTLNLSGNYAEKMLSYYLWEQLTPPSPADLADATYIRPDTHKSLLYVDAQQYMDQIGSRLKLSGQRIFAPFL